MVPFVNAKLPLFRAMELWSSRTPPVEPLILKAVTMPSLAGPFELVPRISEIMLLVKTRLLEAVPVLMSIPFPPKLNVVT